MSDILSPSGTRSIYPNPDVFLSGHFSYPDDPCLDHSGISVLDGKDVGPGVGLSRED